MLIALITDTHYGVRNDSDVLINYSKQFYDEVFFPTLDEQRITTVVHLGDVFDRRKYASFITLDKVKAFYFDKIAERNIDHHIIVGNHDCPLKNSNLPNSPQLLLAEYGFKIYTEAQEVDIGNKTLLFVPWINDENREQSLQTIADSKSRFLMGHLELMGFEMHKGMISEHGLDRVLFSKFDKVMSGHFHKRSTQGNVYYLGCPNEMTWIDYQDTKGFHLFDTANGNLTFIRNPFNLFHRVVYDDTTSSPEELAKSFAAVDLTDKYIKLVVRNKTDPYLFDKCVTQLNDIKPANLMIMEETQLNMDGEQLENLEVDDTPTILQKCVEALDNTTVSKPKLIALLTSLYQEANQLDVQ